MLENTGAACYNYAAINKGDKIKMKRILSIMLCATMLLSMTACGSHGDDLDTEAPVDTTPAGTTPADTTPSGTAPADTTTDVVTTPSDTTAEAATTPADVPSSSALDPSKEYRILLIGNSFTYYNDMNQPNGILYKIATDAGYKVTVDSVYKGGYYLHQYLDENDEYGKQVLLRLRSGHKYDAVVIQDQSNVPISDPADFYDSCREFKTLVEATGAKLYLYETWGYKEGQKDLTKYGRDTLDMEMKLRAASTAIADELDIPVIYVGAAFSKSYTEHPEIELYHTDLKHPGPLGSYLIAWTIFGTVFGVDPVTLSYNGYTQKYGATLRATASEIIKNGAPVDTAYATTSVGVTKK